MLKRGELTVYNLWIHDERHTTHDLVINPDVFSDLVIGDLVEITHYDKNNENESRLLLKVTVIDKDLIGKQLQISIAQNIASQFQFAARSLVTVRKITEVESISVLEIAFRDQYIGRSDMWQLKNSLIGSCVHVGKKVTSLGVRGQIKGIFVNGVSKLSGYVSEQTRPIFRSETAKYFIFIQMSKEMWEFDEDGEIIFEKGVHGFLPELFARWKKIGTNHIVSIVLFARIQYPQEPTNMSQTFHRDANGRYCRDFYRRDVLQMQGTDGSTILMGTNSTASEGNILEAINLALNPFDKHYIDRDLSRTGLSIIVITPSTGIFEVEKKLCRMTTQRMIDNGISLDLVCLSKPPLHSVPLFKFFTKNPKPFNSNPNSYDPSFETGPLSLSIATRSDKSTERDIYSSRIATSEHRKQEVFDYLYTDDELDEAGSYVYMIPDWVDCSFWSRYSPKSDWEVLENNFKSRCKMYEVQMMGMMDMESKIQLPYLDIFNNVIAEKGNFPVSKDPTLTCISYDESLFKVARSKFRSLNSIANEDEFENSMNRYASPDSHGNSSRSTTILNRFSIDEQDRKAGVRLGSSLPKTVQLGSSLPKAIPFVSTANDRWVRESSFPDKQIDLVSKFRKKNLLDGKNDNIKDTYEYSKYSTSREPITIVNQNRSFQTYRNEDHKGSCSTDSRGNSPVTDSHRMFSKGTSPGKTPIKQQFLRHNYVNPFQRGKRVKTGINDKRWEHIFPKWVSHDEHQSYTNWKSLCSPACLPLTIEYFPSQEELSEFYQEYTYNVLPSDEQGTLDSHKIESLLVELIGQRLAQGFQLIVSPMADIAQAKHSDSRKNNAKTDENASVHTVSISKPYYVCLGDHVHKLFYDASGNNVEVKRYTRVVKYNREPMEYTCEIWYRHFEGYRTRTVSFTYPALSTYNWNYLDHLISGNQDQMTDALRFWRIRFLLIPTETPPTFSSGDKLDEEEERLVGFAKFMEHIEKARWITSEEKLQNSEGQNRKSLDIQLTTLNLSSLVASENVHPLLPEAFTKNKSEDIPTKNLERLSKKMNFETIAAAMQKNENVITGAELIDWILQHFEEADSRESAMDIGNYLIDSGLIEHAKQRHKLLDGFYFYHFCKNWECETHGKSNIEANSTRFRFQAVKQVPIDMDPHKKSARPEIALLHYDTTHNTKNCYHFQLHWLVCTARLVEDMLHLWSRNAEKCGFKLVECPGVQASEFGEDNPFQALLPIKLALLPPSLDSLLQKLNGKVRLPDEWFKRELIRSFNFVLDTESDSAFPPNSRGFSYQRKPWPNTQFVHRSGIAFIQILPNDQGFLWVNNRLLLASVNSSKSQGGLPSPDSSRKQFEDFCGNSARLERFWMSLEEKLISVTIVESELSTVYDINSRTLLLKFQKPDKKEMVLLESGVRIHSTSYVRNKEQTPSGFNVKLRKHLRTRRLNSLKQLGQDRRIDLEFGEGEYSFHLIIEFFAAGNIILTDNEYRIMSVLRNVELKDQESIQVGNMYNMENIFHFKPITLERLYNSLTNLNFQDNSSKRNKNKLPNLRNVLRASLGISYGPSVIDWTISKAGLDPNLSNLECFNDSNSPEFISLIEAFNDTDNFIINQSNNLLPGYIVTEGVDNKQMVYDEFHPFYPTHMKSHNILEFESFDVAVDEFFSKIESQRLEQKAKQAEMHAIKKLEAVRQNNLNQIKTFQMSQEDKQLKAAVIEMNLEIVDSAIQTVCSFVASGMDWIDLKELINDEKAKGNPLAEIIADLKLAVGLITLELPNPNIDSDSSDDDSDISGAAVPNRNGKIRIDVDIYQTAFANARNYYTEKKVAVEKEKKTILASAKAINNAEKKILKNLATKESSSAKITKYRTPMWFEKFLWFISSENFLVIGGRDDNQNELLGTKYLEPGDVYVYSDVEGCCSVIVKAIDNDLRNYVSNTTLNQAAALCLSNSKAWDSKIVTSAYWVKSNQLTKVSYAGDSMPLGKFRILGEKNFLPPSQLLMGVGVLFEIESPNAKHFQERRPWAINGSISVADIQNSFIDVHVDQQSLELNSAIVEVDNLEENIESKVVDANEDLMSVDESTDLNEGIIQDISDSIEARSSPDVNEEQLNAKSPKVLSRGQKSKLKKMKKKYADQDDEDRKIMMELLGSAKGPQPKGKKAKALVEKAIEKSSEKEKKFVVQNRQPKPKVKTPNGESISIEIPEVNFDLLTSQPNDTDVVLNCIPVCAPWTVLQKYHCKIKLTPGSQKRGKAAKQVCSLFITFAEKNSASIAEALKLVPEQEWINTMLSKVKVGPVDKK
ncbi:vacuolar membrane-associated protein iml1 [Boothiomyces sp. JEL0866]|nr:vacuolar membrane-associated protein iml1 [Boothiomyces sp. JEL0866]